MGDSENIHGEVDHSEVVSQEVSKQWYVKVGDFVDAGDLGFAFLWFLVFIHVALALLAGLVIWSLLSTSSGRALAGVCGAVGGISLVGAYVLWRCRDASLERRTDVD